MRAIVFLCLLHAVFHETTSTGDGPFSWNDARQSPPEEDPSIQPCVADQTGCGCCLMKTQLERFKEFVHFHVLNVTKYLYETRLALKIMKESRTAFSVALNEEGSVTCLGPFAETKFIKYKHHFINWGSGYDADTGIFTAPCSGVYSITVTIYSTNSTGHVENTCANLEVNGVPTKLREMYSGDPEDSNTVVIAVKLTAEDKVAVKMRQGCIICDDKNHYNTFTGFLLYSTEKVMRL